MGEKRCERVYMTGRNCQKKAEYECSKGVKLCSGCAKTHSHLFEPKVSCWVESIEKDFEACFVCRDKLTNHVHGSINGEIFWFNKKIKQTCVFMVPEINMLFMPISDEEEFLKRKEAFLGKI